MQHDQQVTEHSNPRSVLAYQTPNPTDQSQFPIRSLLLFIVSSGVAGLVCLWGAICLDAGSFSTRNPIEGLVIGGMIWMMACAGAGIIALITLLILWRQKRRVERTGIVAIATGVVYAASTWIGPIAMEAIRSKHTGNGDFVLDSVTWTITFTAFLFGPLIASYVMMGASRRQP